MTGRKRFATIMMSFIPLIAAEAIQFLMIIPVAGILLLTTFRNQTGATYEELVTTLTDALTSVDISSAVSLLYATATIAIFGFWFLKRFRTDSLYPPKQAFHPVLLVGLVFAALGWQVLANYIVELTATISPHSLEVYERIMESAGFDDMNFALILYAVFLGPICEELLFRGVTMNLAKRAMPFWLANLFQALLFGIFHMNVIQGVYAFVLGIFMGYICEKGGNILISICFHITHARPLLLTGSCPVQTKVPRISSSGLLQAFSLPERVRCCLQLVLEKEMKRLIFSEYPPIFNVHGRSKATIIR